MKTCFKTVYLIAFAYAGMIKSQEGRVGINTDTPSVTLDITAKKTDGSQAEGLKVPTLAGNSLFNANNSGQYGALQDGTVVYVSSAADPGKRFSQTEYVDAKGPYYFDASRGLTGKWVRIGIETSISPLVSILNCTGVLNSGNIFSGVSTSGATSVVPYTGGNGALYNAQDVISTGVTGLIAHLSSGTLSSGNGSFTYSITGTPSSAGTAIFPIIIAGQSCSFTRTVVLPPASISGLDCAGPLNNGTLVQGTAASSVSSVISYTGGNGGTYSSQTVFSTNVGGLTATIAGGTVANGSGSLTYTISGTPSSSGIAYFNINIGGQNCILSRNVILPAASLSSLNCGGASVSGTLTNGVAANGVSAVLSYTGGNGGTYNGQSISSTGIPGLSATISAGTLSNGSGTLHYTITGIPSGVGIASFAISLGGQNCTLNLTVNAVPGTVYSFDCSGAYHNGSLQGGQTATGVSTVISYTGGDGGNYSGQSVTSTGVTGLTATLSAGTLTNGSGTVAYVITGTPSSDGIAYFAVSLGGQNCSFSRVVGCGAYTAPGVYRRFLCHNLGADTSLNPHDTSQPNAYGLNGAYIKWGLRGPNITGDSRIDWQTAANDGPNGFAASPTGASPGASNPGQIGSWSSYPLSIPNYSWLSPSGVKTGNDPCPAGYRIPTYSEWVGVNGNNTITRTGTWNDDVSNYSSSLSYGSDGIFKRLTLPSGGMRDGGDLGRLRYRGSNGYYWSSTEYDIYAAYFLQFSSTSTQIYGTALNRAYGMSIRCIAQ